MITDPVRSSISNADAGQLIDAMCMTWDHSFGLMPEDKRASLRLCIGQLIQHDIGPYIARAIMAAKAEEREACALLLDEGFEREGVKHKNDECSHGRFGYEDCEQCASAAIRKRGDVNTVRKNSEIEG